MHKLIGGTPAQFRTCKAHYLARSVGRHKRRYTGVNILKMFWLFQKNDGIGTAPYKAMFGVEPHLGLRDTQLRGAPARLLRTEQELADMPGLVADGSRQTATDAGLDSQSGSSSSDWQPAGRAHAGRRRSGRAVVCSSSSTSSSSDEEPASCTPGRSGPTVAVAGSSSSDEEPASCTPGRSGPAVAVAGSSKGMQQSPVAAVC